MGIELIYAAAALGSSAAAVLAWAAKLRWAKEYTEATNQVIKAKDAEIAALKTENQVLVSVGSGKILEHAASTRMGLEEIIRTNEEELKGTRATIEGLKIEIASQARETPALPLGDTRRPPNTDGSRAADGSLPELEAELRNAIREELLLREKALAFRAIDLETAPALEEQHARTLARLREHEAAVQRGLDEAMAVWLQDRQDAETKLQSFRDRGLELKEQIQQARHLGPQGKCPTCGRPVGDDCEQLNEELEEQWAIVVQDGKWWASRFSQLRTKPDEVAVLETALRELRRDVEEETRLHARAEADAQEYINLLGSLADLRMALYGEEPPPSDNLLAPG
jgi:hypothetical protein